MPSLQISLVEGEVVWLGASFNNPDEESEENDGEGNSNNNNVEQHEELELRGFGCAVTVGVA